MTKYALAGTALLYWVCFAARAYLWNKDWTRANRRVSMLEKCALLLFTAGLVAYIGKLQVIDGQVRSDFYDMPVSFLLFAWAVSAANLISEITYGNRWSAPFADFWTGLSLTLSPAAAVYFHSLFTYDLQWLSFHRMFFLLGYASCLLALPIVLLVCYHSWQLKREASAQRKETELRIAALDRMAYRMILWALPLLTAGIMIEALVLLEANQLPSPEEIWTDKQETLLALVAWMVCGLSLHARLFLGWKNLRVAWLYLAGLFLLVFLHLTHGFSQRG